MAVPHLILFGFFGNKHIFSDRKAFLKLVMIIEDRNKAYVLMLLQGAIDHFEKQTTVEIDNVQMMS